jgi:chemotaxis protein CheD
MTHRKERFINVIQGDFAISDAPDAVLTTVLGSCIAVCMCDRTRGIGGMNHFLLPGGQGDDTGNMRYGANAMELLINGLLKRGAVRDRLEAKMFGGARMIGNLRNIGASNIEFARNFLAEEDITCLAESVGGTSARRIRFWPTTGVVRQLMVTGDLEPELPPPPPPPPQPAGIELF